MAQSLAAYGEKETEKNTIYDEIQKLEVPIMGECFLFVNQSLF